MSVRLQKYLILPLALIMVSLYLLGLRVWQNQQCELNAPMIAENSVVVGAESQGAEGNSAIKKLNINTATKEELMTLDGIGAAYADRILEKREMLGGFKTLEQLKEVKGIGEKTFEGIKNDITIE
ncbi:MAG: helix-hairpin-helix domain-containing protein [Clostridia bacterium]|nr:helix-hairpin-helix domain-containing protein [Clostridia bacterium]